MSTTIGVLDADQSNRLLRIVSGVEYNLFLQIKNFILYLQE